jgi:hypothetical protein
MKRPSAKPPSQGKAHVTNIATCALPLFPTLSVSSAQCPSSLSPIRGSLPRSADASASDWYGSCLVLLGPAGLTLPVPFENGPNSLPPVGSWGFGARGWRLHFFPPTNSYLTTMLVVRADGLVDPRHHLHQRCCGPRKHLGLENQRSRKRSETTPF